MTSTSLYVVLEVFQLIQQQKKYFAKYENYLQVVMSGIVFFFVFPYDSETCWPQYDESGWRWLFGAVGIFLAWVNTFLLLKDAPLVGLPITMLLNVYYNFIINIYLPLLLVLTFCVPFYMLFFRNDDEVCLFL